jgi:polyisoprenoid-binding protein YceI
MTNTVPRLAAGTWRVDPSRTTCTFRVRKLGLIRVHGSFALVRGQAETDQSGLPAAGTAVLDVASIRTGIKKRDLDLRGVKFFDAENFPRLSYRADRMAPTDAGWRVEGFLRVKSTDAPLTLDVVAEPEGDGWRVRATGILDRQNTPIRVPRAIVGRWINITVEAFLAPPDA